jgi:outer membrane protein assembly factor BamB
VHQTPSNGNPVVADGKIFLGTNNGSPGNPEIQDDKGVLMCFRESDGTFVQELKYGTDED